MLLALWLAGQAFTSPAVAATPGVAALGRVQRAEQFLSQGLTIYALSELGYAQKLAPDSPEVGVRLAQVHLRMSDADQAQIQLAETLKRFPDCGEAYRVRAGLRYAAGRYDAACADATAAIRCNPHDPRNFLGRAAIHERQKRPESARDDLTAALKLAPRRADLYLKRSALWAELGEWEDAWLDADIASELLPTQDEPRVRKAELLLALGLDDAALRMVEPVRPYQMTIQVLGVTTAEAKTPANPPPAGPPRGVGYYSEHPPEKSPANPPPAGPPPLNPPFDSPPQPPGPLGVTLASFVKPAAPTPAVAATTKVLELVHPAVRGIRIHAAANRHDWDGAIAEFTAWLSNFPGTVAAHSGRGQFLIDLGRNAEAEADFDAVLRDDPDHVEALIGRALARLARGDAAGAAPALKRVARLAPDSLGLRYAQGRDHFARSDFAAAKAEFTHCLQAHPFYADAAASLIETLLELGEYRDAARLATLRLLLTPDPRQRARLATLLDRAREEGE